MEDWNKMSIYADSRVEEIRRQVEADRFLERTFEPAGRVILVAAAVLLGMVIWWIV